MAMEIKNRRENILINSIPPEILTAEQAADAALEAVADAGYLTEETAATAGFVKNTDYATGDVAGVIKYNNTTGTTVNSSGVLTGITRTEAQYNSGGNGTIICKGTLENIIATLVKRELIALLGGIDDMPAGSTLTAWKAERTADGWTVSSTMTIPPTP